MFLMCFASLFADVKMTEVMTCNVSSYMDRETWNFPRYLELYNTNEEDVSLNGYYIEHHNKTKKGKYKYKWGWSISQDINIPAHSYKLLFFDGDSLVDSHSSKKLDSDGGRILLYKGEELIDEFDYEPMVSHVSYGIDAKGISGYMEPSPLKDNTESFSSLNQRTNKVIFSNALPGFQYSPTSLELVCKTPDASIYYTLDGSQPTRESYLYDPSNPIYLTSTTCVKAVAFTEKQLSSEILCGTFVFYG